jgi:alpha-mannosidase
VPVYAAEPPSLALVKTHSSRPEEESFFAVFPANVVMTGMKQAEEGEELIVRLVEVEGKETTATIKLPINANSVRRLDLIEFPLKNATAASIQGKSVTIKLRPHEIVTLGIK